jgi:3'(2'), 5'-bisphosphate nucleotidase
MFETELSTAIALAREAAAAILDEYALEIVAEGKLGSDNFWEPVTEADRRASRILTSGLAAAFPTDAVLSEEEPDDVQDRLSKERVWIIDPIDGTAGFIKKDGDFAVQVGLAVNGEPVVGVVCLPYHDVLYSASRGGGGFVYKGKGEPEALRVSSKADFGQMNLAISRNHPSPKMAKVIETFGVKRSMKRGSVGLKIGLIAERACDMYIHLSPRTKVWDTCAPQVILEEAGGQLTDLFGERYTYHRRDVQNLGGIVASNGISHRAAVEKLRPLLAEFGRSRSKKGSSS